MPGPRQAHHMIEFLWSIRGLFAMRGFLTSFFLRDGRHGTSKRFSSGLVLGALLVAVPLTAQADLRSDLQKDMRDLALRGYVTPENADLSTYPQETLESLKTLTAGQSDPCLRAVQSALFLDAHIRETGLEQAWDEMWDQKLPQELAGIWIMPDGFSAAGNLAEFTTLKWLPGLVGDASLVANLVKTYDTLINHNAKAVLASREVWVQEIVQTGFDQNRDEDTVLRGQAQLRDKIERQSAVIDHTQERARDAIALVERTYSEGLDAAERAHENSVDALRVEADNNQHTLDTPAMRERRANIDLALTQATQALLWDRKAGLDAALAAREYSMSLALQAIAKARVQHDALERYTLPIARKNCAEITKTGAPSKAIPCAPEDTLCHLTRLPHDQLMATMAQVGAKPSEAFMTCLCRTAGYGSSSTSQFYHPDTLGTYDERYSCQHPGPPCVVAGYGCGRHNLPSDGKIWATCGAAAEARSEPNPVAKFTGTVQDRAQALDGAD